MEGEGHIWDWTEEEAELRCTEAVFAEAVTAQEALKQVGPFSLLLTLGGA